MNLIDTDSHSKAGFLLSYMFAAVLGASPQRYSCPKGHLWAESGIRSEWRRSNNTHDVDARLGYGNAHTCIQLLRLVCGSSEEEFLIEGHFDTVAYTQELSN